MCPEFWEHIRPGGIFCEGYYKAIGGVGFWNFSE